MSRVFAKLNSSGKTAMAACALGLFFTMHAWAAPATGTINGVSWTFVSGKAETSGNNFKITLWNQSFASPCTEWQGSVFDVRAIFPAKAGSYNVDPNGFSQNVIVMGDGRVPGSPNNNIFANVGTMKITQITATAVSGTFTAASAFTHSNLSGDFIIPLCSSGAN